MGRVASQLLLVAVLAVACGEREPTAPVPVPRSNMVPVVTDSIGEVRVRVGETREWSASRYFTDPDGDALSYTAETTDAGVVVATVSEDVFGIAPGSHGTATVTITATDAGGLSVSLDFSVAAVPLPSETTLTVRSIYAHPNDRPFNADYSAAIREALEDLQLWYMEQLGGIFILYDSIPQPCELAEDHDYYVEGGYPRTWRETLAAVRECAPVDYGAESHAWVVHADISEPCGTNWGLGRGTLGLTMVGAMSLKGLVDPELQNCRGYAYGINRWIGGLGHELGHAFGLPHPPECSDGLPSCDHGALMWTGYAHWPDTHLRDDEKAVLLNLPYFVDP